MKITRFLGFLLITGLLTSQVFAQVAGNARLKDLINIEGAVPTKVTGYGLVIGLDRTGDRARGMRGSPQTVQSIANMLRNQFGITVDPAQLTSRNVAAVMVTATISPFSQAGGGIDVTVAAIGDAKSLSGGILLETPLVTTQSSMVMAIAQGAVSTGAIQASSQGSSIRVNHSNTGRIPGGGLIYNSPQMRFDPAGGTIGLTLRRPDFTNASRIATAINRQFPGAATAAHAGLVNVAIPAAEQQQSIAFLAQLENIGVSVDVPARVVINERTGTIVAGGNVHISEVMVTYGSIIVSTQEEAFVSQPNAFGQGETVAGRTGEASVEEESTNSVVLAPNTDVNQLAATLNELGLSARDVIAIFQAIDTAGALQGELIIL